jgi:hypothetical protein
MFKKEKTEEAPVVEDKKKVEDTAYEDSWYRSLKALAERPADQSDEEVGTPED